MFLTQVWLEHTGNTLKIEIYGEYERNKTGIILFNNQMVDIHLEKKRLKTENVSLAFGDFEKKSKLSGSELQRT